MILEVTLCTTKKKKKRKVNTNPAINSSIYSEDLPERYAAAIVAQSRRNHLYTSIWLDWGPFHDLEPMEWNTAQVAKSPRQDSLGT